MIDLLGNLGDFIGGFAVVGGLVFVGIQLKSARDQMQAGALQARIDTRINLWISQVKEGAYASARVKMRDHDLHVAEVPFMALPHLDIAEIAALQTHFSSELVYLQYLFYLRKKRLIEPDQALPLNRIDLLWSAPCRAQWKMLRPTGNFPEDFCQHVDEIAARWESGDLT